MYMNRLALILTLTCAVTAAAMPAYAGLTGTVTVNGMVPAVCAVIVTPETGASNIADISLGDTNRLIATVNETCNDPNGYTMTMVGTNSANNTGLFRDTVSNATQPFNVTYNNVSVPAGGVVTNANAPGIALSKPVKITYAANASLTPTTAYTYSETLTFTIAAK